MCCTQPKLRECPALREKRTNGENGSGKQSTRYTRKGNNAASTSTRWNRVSGDGPVDALQEEQLLPRKIDKREGFPPQRTMGRDG